ncbi:MAG: hypothetical protein GXO76_11640 [Calditrichaeota bacterium]|nr:hypothetical protein [Calditrichota bacterium]
MKKMEIIVLTGFLSLFILHPGFSQTPHYSTQKYGVAVVSGLGMPIMALSHWYKSAPQVGIQAVYQYRKNVEICFEFHYQHFTHGSIEKRKFQWLVDDQFYASPKASAHMIWNDFIISVRQFYSRKSFQLLGKSIIPYSVFGTGLYNYVHHVSGLIYPGQPRQPIDLNFLMEPVSDRRVAWGATAGAGLEMPVAQRIKAHVQLNYHAIIGYMRPFEDWGFSEITPIQFLSVRMGVLFWF